MFEKIKMINLTLDKPVKPINFVSEKEKYEKILEGKGISIEHSIRGFDSDFLIDGSVSFLPSLLVSEYALKNFLYIQTFGLFHTNHNYYTNRKDYNSYQLLYTYEGSGTLEYEGNTYTMSRGEGFFIDCQKPHYYFSTSDTWLHSVLHFNGSNAPYIFNEFYKYGTVKFYSPTEGYYQNNLENLLYTYSNKSNHHELLVSNLLETLLCSLLKEFAQQSNIHFIPDTYRYLTKYMDNNFSAPLTLDELAKFSGLSKYHLCREFKKYIGYSPNEYLINLRITHAKTLLESTNIPSYKVGILVGIPNENNFINLFKKHVGLTPGMYRKQTFR